MGKSNQRGSDISNKTVVIALVVVIFVSIVALGVFINALNSAEPKVASISQGKVSLEIVEPPKAPQVVKEGGEVGVTVVEPKNVAK